MFLYTWKDVEWKILNERTRWGSIISDIEAYNDELIIYLKTEDNLDQAELIVSEILEEKYDSVARKICLDLSGQSMDVIYEVDEARKRKETLSPLFKNIIYQESAYSDDLVREELPGVPVIAFHSYKGGVGRTLSLLAFAKAWSSLKNEKSSKRLLIVDADMEAPGITWLSLQEDDILFSFLDLLEVIQEKDNMDEVAGLVSKKILPQTVQIETEKRIEKHIVLPTYRYIQQLLDMYSSPESLALSLKKKYALAETLSLIGKNVNAELVLVDLRAGLSELSAPLLFDPRVKKFLVTSTSYQSVRGTEILLQQLCKGLPIDEKTKIPEILLTMVQEGIDTSNTVSKFAAIYENNISDDNNSITDGITTELPFASELVHLDSLSKIMRNLNGREFYTRIYEIVRNSYMPSFEENSIGSNATRENVIRSIHDYATRQITAEGNGRLGVLMTNSIQNLIEKYRTVIPNTVIMGAKGSGKTFLYREILKRIYWQRFIADMEREDERTDSNRELEDMLVLPLLATGNSGEFGDIIASAVANYNELALKAKFRNFVSVESSDSLKEFLREQHDTLEWKEEWKRIILDAFDNAYSSLEELDEDLKEAHKKVLLLVDGMEEIFDETAANPNHKSAVSALCKDLIDEIRLRYRNFGLMVFVRKDMVRDAISINYEQFYSQYKSVELQWSSTEALRLAVWLTDQAAKTVNVDFYTETVGIETATREVLDRTLQKLWGVKLGKPTSNEAYSSRWILAALSDFNGHLQARDIIRFLEKATASIGDAVYSDRYLMPKEIKKAVSECSFEKITEIREEIKGLGAIFDKMDAASVDKKVLPFSGETFSLSQEEEKLMKAEGYLKVENDKYYLPEIIRHALSFKYAKGARPKVLSLLLKH